MAAAVPAAAAVVVLVVMAEVAAVAEAVGAAVAVAVAVAVGAEDLAALRAQTSYQKANAKRRRPSARMPSLVAKQSRT